MANARPAGHSLDADKRLLDRLLDHLVIEPSGSLLAVGRGQLAQQVARRARHASRTAADVGGAGGRVGKDRPPYDRIVVTTQRWDLSPEWRPQLAAEGLLDVALRLRGATHFLRFERDGRYLSARGSRLYLAAGERGGRRHPGERSVAFDLAGERPVLTWDRDQPIDPAGLGQDLDRFPGARLWTEVTAGESDDLAGLWLILAASHLGACGLSGGTGARIASLATPAGTPALVDGTTIAYLTRRVPQSGASLDSGRTELGVAAYGPGAGRLSARFADCIRQWSMTGDKATRIVASPVLGYPRSHALDRHTMQVQRYRTRFVITAEDRTAPRIRPTTGDTRRP
ncbi:hypothetical protein [Amycolatopsis alba]|uniref:Uncharacterized protein n=1 Tax=Amycolatopsis alba DSM 44262 TaxID=1125972 RepID=A0A229R924_AMYAL|nr:hypothetical protein [Amycolatopsis alba]OXM43136.1 hypothetical protein CFP75_39745 [Amycolatopsis alba DSM 44262]